MKPSPSHLNLNPHLNSHQAHLRAVGEILPAEAGVPAGTPALAGSTLRHNLMTTRECVEARAPGAIQLKRKIRFQRAGIAAIVSFLLSTTLSIAETPNLLPAQSPLPDLGFSAVRVFGALVLVLALFLGGVWLFRNWQRVAVYKGRPPKLNVLEVKSLGSRHALYLVAYEQQRLLISSSPAGISLLSHLPEAGEEAVGPVPASPTFAQSLRQVLAPKP